MTGIYASEIRAIATPGGKPGVKLGAELFDQLPNLEIISPFSNGLDAIDVPAAFAQNIAVTHAPCTMAEPVADVGWP
jgi:lactate dehydrogenase-like 2-hydroxyacid dehydrogenase